LEMNSVQHDWNSKTKADKAMLTNEDQKELLIRMCKPR